MSTLQPASKRHPQTQWRARVTWRGIEHYVGGYPTKEEADEAERRFKARRKQTDT